MNFPPDPAPIKILNKTDTERILIWGQTGQRIGVNFTGGPSTITWSKNSIPLNYGEKNVAMSSIYYGEVRESFLTFVQPVREDLAGNYTFTVSNEFGTDFLHINVTICEFFLEEGDVPIFFVFLNYGNST